MKPLLVFLAALATAQAADYKLTSSPTTVVWGNYWADAKPVLRIKSGDTVEILTMSTSSPAALARVGVKDEDIQPEWKAIYANQPPREERGPGGHILTGPIFIEGAEPGDVLEVRIQKIKLATPYAYNGFSPTRGVLVDGDFKEGKSRLIPLDLQRNVAKFAGNIEIPLHPFFGSMGVAPDRSKGKIDSAPPGDHAGNIDNKDMVEGTTLYIPVHATGAMFEVGDGHAGQGNGEVDITAMETSLVGTFQFVVRKDMKLKWPRGETPTHWIAMGLDKDLTQALILAVKEAIDFLVTEKHMTREDAYALCSVAVDFNVTQAVDGTKGVHVMIPKSIFK
jgi:acetamidase/formamidase